MAVRSGIRGVEHVGLTAPDHDAAVKFFERAFGATRLFSLVRPDGPSLGADELGPKNGLAPGMAIKAVTMMRLGDGPNVEIFEIDRPGRTEHSGIGDFGLSHFSLTVDDVDETCVRFVEAGGTLLDGPYELEGQEKGPGNLGRFGFTPWGLLVEFESFGSPCARDDGTVAPRWIPAERQRELQQHKETRDAEA